MTPTKRKLQSPPPSKTPQPEGSIRIIKKVSDCPKVSPTAHGSLRYEAGFSEADQSLYIRVTGNTGGGFFSKQWISLDDIEAAIGSQGGAFKATVFRPLYSSSGANNHGFLAAALRAEGILEESEDHPLSHEAGDFKAFRAAMANLVKEGVDLHDEVAEEEALKAERKAAMLERLKSASKAKEAKQ